MGTGIDSCTEKPKISKINLLVPDFSEHYGSSGKLKEHEIELFDTAGVGDSKGRDVENF